MKQLAIIGPTASGKSNLALELAQECNAYILSIDSLSVYKEIDIVSAKPSKSELKKILHFGIDELYPNEHFSVDIFINIYKKAKETASKEKKNLIMVGGTSFYLKTLIEGISPIPKIEQETIIKTKNIMKNIIDAYNLLKKVDPLYVQTISSCDRYRIEKALLIYFSSNLPPSIYFMKNPKIPFINDLTIYEIDIDRETLRKKIETRTKKMIKMGLIDEVAYLEKKYTREPNPMKAIGIKETLEYLDGKYNKEKLIEKITTNTARLAKRQQIFNKTQFDKKTCNTIDKLYELIKKDFC
ncbi:tRNA (adenosine(37)-N6)-dimethylallyltransferase MiaA [Nitrosophilus labii]|uniref:tRNA (adenosine(37)-N6)-dimethylallyltransferase MiaA n=1 Tax=Nitrosophilus labii TaxID=2706014 RepID=UPI0016576377|nr:tRNA (adenosine(37)-N6)-dimethylallyltransferase MiaA [Nitrosophilus labii]